MKIQVTDEHRACAKELCEMLGETEAVPRLQIQRVVVVLGTVKAQQMAESAARMEGIVKVKDGSRPRTKGGVFFSMVKFLRQQKILTSKQYHYIVNARYVLEQKQAKKEKKGKVADAPVNHVAAPLQQV